MFLNLAPKRIELLPSATIGRIAMRQHAIGLLSLLLVPASGIVQASDPDNYWMNSDRFAVSIGSFIIDNETKFRLSPDIGIGTTINLENDLQVDSSQSELRIDAHYRFAARHRLGFSYVDLSRDGVATTQRPLFIGNEIYLPGTQINSDWGFEIAKIAYTYSFYQNPTTELGFTAGLFGINFDVDIVSEDGRREGEDELLPLPVIGIKALHRLAEKWTLEAHMEAAEAAKREAAPF